jgi:methyl-accepting chemotaxis protein
MRTAKIGTKLMLSAAAMLALSMILGYSGLSTLEQCKKRFDTTVDVSVRKIQLADEILTTNAELVGEQRGIALAAYTRNASSLSDDAQAFEESYEQMQSDLIELETLVTTPEGRQLTADITERLAEWRPHYEEMKAQSVAGNGPEANRIRKEVTAPIYKKLGDAAAEVSMLEQAMLVKDQAAMKDLNSHSHWVAFGLLGLSLLAGGVLVWVVRSVTRSLRRAVAELSQGAAQVLSAAAQVSASSQSLAQGSSEQAASLEETSASSEEISSMARKNTENSETAAGLVTQSQDKFVQTNQSLEHMVAAMDQITTQSSKISKIIKVIDEIAFQTNILALNAAVEAARAGEAGMGFAVVADEVRNLAQRCAQAAKDTAELIEESINKSHEGKHKVDQVAADIRAITGDATKVKTLVDEVSLGSQEQARGVQQVAQALAQMDQVTQRSAASAEESASAAEELRAQSQALHEVVEQLTAMVGDDSGR